MALFKYMPFPKIHKDTQKKKRYFIIDFDSTFVKDETLEVLAGFALKDNPKKAALLKKISSITDRGMAGKISFAESLKRRLLLFSANKNHLKQTTEYLRGRVSASIEKNRSFFEKHANDVYIISNGFRECIVPIAKEYGIPTHHVLANRIKFNSAGVVVGVEKHVLSEGSGKAKAVKNLKLQGEVIIVGDGITDYEIRSSGAADAFFALTENVARSSVIKKADFVIRGFDEVLYHYKLPRGVFYPHGRLKVLLLEKIHPLAEERLRAGGYTIETASRALSEEELLEKIGDVAILGIRSGTRVTERVLDRAKRLIAIGAFCIGTNQIDLTAASKQGVAVFNAPYSNGRSVAELVAGLIIMLSRGVFDKSTTLHKGGWNKSAHGSHEIRGRTLGIVGYGNIGSQLSVIAESLGMGVRFFDIKERPAIGNAQHTNSLDELLAESDFITLHVDGRPDNKNFFGAEQFAKMRQGAHFINLSRGHVVDINALKNALKSGHAGGAAVDVFPSEPKGGAKDFSSPLQNVPNVILTPHIGGSTEEAQESIAQYLSGKLMSFIDTGDTALSVNLPNLQLPPFSGAHRFIHIHRNVPGVLANINAVMSRHQANILGQYLGTTVDVGYVITDANTNYEELVIKELNAIPGTLRVRTLY